MLTQDLTTALLRVQGKLDAATSVEREGVSPSEEASHERRASESRWEVYWRFQEALPEVKKVVKNFGVRDGLDWKQTRAELRKKTQNELKSNDYAVALSAFLSAMHKYLGRYIHAESLQFDSPGGLGVCRR